MIVDDIYRTHYGLAFDAYAVEYIDVTRTDNAGEPCDYCDDIDAVNTRTVYGTTRHGENWSVDCCGRCVPRLVVDYLDPSYDVRVECMRSLAVWVPSVEITDAELYDNGLMAHPDDTRPHPDAA